MNEMSLHSAHSFVHIGLGIYVESSVVFRHSEVACLCVDNILFRHSFFSRLLIDVYHFRALISYKKSADSIPVSGLEEIRSVNYKYLNPLKQGAIYKYI